MLIRIGNLLRVTPELAKYIQVLPYSFLLPPTGALPYKCIDTLPLDNKTTNRQGF